MNILLPAVSAGGSLQYAAPRRCVSSETSTATTVKAKFGSTATLTEGGSGSGNGDDDEDSEIGRVDSSNYYFYANGSGGGGTDNGTVGSNGDYNSDSKCLVVFICRNLSLESSGLRV